MGRPKMNFLMEHFGKLMAAQNWPNAPIASATMATEYTPFICKMPYDYLFRDDPVAMAECTLLTHEFLDVDLFLCNLDAYNFEAEAMGAEILYFPDHCPDFNRENCFIKGPEDLDKIKFTGLDKGRLQYLVDYCKAYKSYVGIDTFPTLSGPWTLAGNLYGIDNLVMEVYDDPDFVTELLRRIVEDFQIPAIRALNDAIPGMMQLYMADAYASIPVVNVPIVEEFIKPALANLKDNLNIPNISFMDTAFFGTAHLSGEDRRKYEDFIVWSNGNYISGDPDTITLTPEYARRRANDYGLPFQIALDAKVIQFGTKQEVIDRVKWYALAGKNGPTPCIFFFSNFAPNAPLENIRAAVQSLKIYGAPGTDENTPYVEPESLEFEDFLKHKLENNTEGYSFDWLKKSGYAHLA